MGVETVELIDWLLVWAFVDRVCFERVVIWELHRQVAILLLPLNPLNETKLLQLIIFADIFKLDATLSRKTGLLILDSVYWVASDVFIAAWELESV